MTRVIQPLQHAGRVPVMGQVADIVNQHCHADDPSASARRQLLIRHRPHVGFVCEQFQLPHAPSDERARPSPTVDPACFFKRIKRPTNRGTTDLQLLYDLGLGRQARTWLGSMGAYVRQQMPSQIVCGGPCGKVNVGKRIAFRHRFLNHRACVPDPQPRTRPPASIPFAHRAHSLMRSVHCNYPHTIK